MRSVPRSGRGRRAGSPLSSRAIGTFQASALSESSATYQSGAKKAAMKAAACPHPSSSAPRHHPGCIG